MSDNSTSLSICLRDHSLKYHQIVSFYLINQGWNPEISLGRDKLQKNLREARVFSILTILVSERNYLRRKKTKIIMVLTNSSIKYRKVNQINGIHMHKTQLKLKNKNSN